MTPVAALARPNASPLARYLGERLETMHPAYFALAMATGIVSIAAYRLAMHELARLLFGLNLVAYAALWGATALRVALYPGAFSRDWGSHQRAPGFFTWVAATCVVGTQCATLAHAPGAAFTLWCLALVLWVGCTYAVFTTLIVREEKPSLEQGINGGWLVAVVATQAICVLGASVLPGRLAPDTAGFVLAGFWLAGGMLYVWLIGLIFYRYTFFRLAPGDLAPPYWINMGAVAISTLAGTALVGVAPASPLLTELLPFIKGVTLLCWATATWWIPLLLALGAWRHLVRRVPVAYDPLYWGLVFPFGMYSVCTLRMHEIFGPGFLRAIAAVAGVAAVLAWTTTFFGLLGRWVYTSVLAVHFARRPAPGRAAITVSPECPALATPPGGEP